MFSLETFAVRIKLATLVPKGTNLAITLKDFSQEVKKKTEGRVKFQVYYGGIQGDEPDVLRKTRVGQLHGGVFTGKTLGDIFSDVRIMEVPFNFYHDEKKALDALTKNTDYFNQEIAAKGFVNLGFYGIGKVYVASSKKVTSINELKGVKMWAWEGDKLVRAMMDSLGLVSVPLALPDVMSSLSTGIIDAAYAPPLGILALQWQNQVKYIIDFPIAYSIGALLITQKQWKKISDADKKMIRSLAQESIAKANKLAIEDNKKSLSKLKELGIELLEFSKNDLAKAEKIRKDVLDKLESKILSKRIINEVEKLR